MASRNLASEVSGTRMTEFFSRFGRFGGSKPKLRKLLGDDKLMKKWVRQLLEFPEFRLIHGLFHTLEEKIEMVKEWPGIADRFTEDDFRNAVKEARTKGRLKRFEEDSPGNPSLDIVVVPYLGSVIETFNYARNRLREAIDLAEVHNGFLDEEDLFVRDDLEKRLTVVEGVPHPTNRIKVEVVDLGARPQVPDEEKILDMSRRQVRDQLLPALKDPSDKRLAHVQVLYAAAQDHGWLSKRGAYDAFLGGYRVTRSHGKPEKLLPIFQRIPDHVTQNTISFTPAEDEDLELFAPGVFMPRVCD